MPDEYDRHVCLAFVSSVYAYTPGVYASKHFRGEVKKTKTQEKTQSQQLEKTKTQKLQLESSARAGTVNSPRFQASVGRWAVARCP